MNDGPKSEPNQQKNRSRRSILKTSGLALGASITGLGAVTGAVSAKDSISADMVKPGKPESAERFVVRTLDLGKTKDVIQAYENLSKDQLQAVRDAVDRLSTYSLEINENATSADVSPMAIPASKTATLTKTIAGAKVHETTHTLEYQIHTSNDTLSDADNSSTGSAPAALWHHKGLYDSFLQVQSNNTEVYSTRSHEYTHSVGGQVIVHEASVIDIHGTASGSFDVTKNIVSL